MASSAPTSSATATTILLKSNPVHHTNAEWISNRESIKQLYLVEKLSLTNLRREMEDRYGFHASNRQYKTRLQKWNFRRSIKTSERVFMVHKRNSRLELGRQTTFELCGREIDHDELVGRSGTTMADSISIPQLATTPPDVAYFTPPNTEPVMQLQTSALWLDGPFLDELSQLMEPEMFDVDLIDVDLNQDENEFWVGQMDWEENMLIWGSS